MEDSENHREMLSKASIIDITDPALPVVLVGNATMNVTLKDYGEPGDKDMLGVTVWDKSGKLLYSSNWSVKTIEQVLGGGNIQLHLDPVIASMFTVVQQEEIFLPFTRR